MCRGLYAPQPQRYHPPNEEGRTIWRVGVLDHIETNWYLSGQAASNGTTATAALGPVATGTVWYVERLSCYSASSGNPVLEIAVQTANTIPSPWDRASREDYTPAAKNDIADELHPIFVPESNFIVAYWTALNNNDWAYVGFQIAIHTLPLVITDPTIQREVNVPGLDGKEDVHAHIGHNPPVIIPAEQGPPEASDEEPTPEEKEILATADLFKGM